jgi:hypothetical protein
MTKDKKILDNITAFPKETQDLLGRVKIYETELLGRVPEFRKKSIQDQIKKFLSIKIASKRKRVKAIRDEWCDSEASKISKDSLDMLKKHLEGNDPDTICEAMSLVTDARIMEFVPLMEKHLTNEWNIVREFAIGKLLGLLKLPQYAEIGLKMAQEDESAGVRCLATTGLGYVIDNADAKTKKAILSYFYDVISKDIYDADTKQDVYKSITIALDIPWEQRPSIVENPDLSKIVKPDIIQKFKEKYGL